MKTCKLCKILLAAAACFPSSLTFAGVSASASYAISTDTFSGGQTLSASPAYGNLGTLEPFVGIGQAPIQSVVIRNGFMGEVYEFIALQLVAASTTVAEGQTRQVSGFLIADDLTTLGLSADAITWSIQSGPIQSITSGGLVTADSVTSDTAATVQGSYAGLSAFLGLTVLDINVNNLVAIAFGLNPTLAAPAQLPQPQRVGSNYVVNFTQPAGLTGFTYGAEWSPTLAPGSWLPMTDTGIAPQHNFSVPIGGNEKIFVRLNVSGP